jgi:hypothetical protein
MVATHRARVTARTHEHPLDPLLYYRADYRGGGGIYRLIASHDECLDCGRQLTTRTKL